jgi:transcriptional antiterminator NusG
MSIVEHIPEPGEKLWYVLKVQSNRERSIRESLVRRIKREGLEEYFGEVIIPTEKIVDTKGGKKRVTEKKLFPGYIMVEMELNDETWYLVRETSGVGDFTGTQNKPVPMQEHEIARMLGKEESEEVAAPRIKIEFSPGDIVKIKEGTFESFEGTIEEIDQSSGKISVLIEIFNRTTPVELEYWQVEAV